MNPFLLIPLIVGLIFATLLFVRSLFNVRDVVDDLKTGHVGDSKTRAVWVGILVVQIVWALFLLVALIVLGDIIWTWLR